jgi:hypothetical protein
VSVFLSREESRTCRYGDELACAGKQSVTQIYTSERLLDVDEVYLVLQTLQFDEHLACNSAPSEGFTVLFEDKLDCLNLSCFGLNFFKLSESIHYHAF